MNGPKVKITHKLKSDRHKTLEEQTMFVTWCGHDVNLLPNTADHWFSVGNYDCRACEEAYVWVALSELP